MRLKIKVHEHVIREDRKTTLIKEQTVVPLTCWFDRRGEMIQTNAELLYRLRGPNTSEYRGFFSIDKSNFTVIVEGNK